VRRAHPFIGKTHDELDGRRWKGGRAKGLGPAEHLLDVLKAKQTSPDGKVYYHRTITYKWIRSLVPNPPPARTLRRWMAILVERGEVVSLRRREGFKLRLTNSRKWATQLSLFAPPAVRVFPSVRDRDREVLQSRSVEKPVDYQYRDRPKVASQSGHKWPHKEVREPTTETSNTRAQKPRAISQGQKMAARRILGEIDRICEIYAGSFDPADLARRDQRIDLLYAELQTTGWQEERAG
jgi:hypothetical protein